MHVVCRDLEAAKELLQWGIACGFRESGVVLGNKKIMCAIRTNANGLEIPIGHTAKELLVSDHYLKWIVAIANEKFVANKKKTDQLLEAFKAKFYPQNSAAATQSEDVVTSVAFDQFKELKCETMKRVGHTSVGHGTSIVVFGGQGATASGTTSRLAALTILSTADDNSLKIIYEDPATPTAATPSARMQHSAVVVRNDMIVFGGRAGPTKPFNDVHAFNLDTKVWTVVETLGDSPSPRYKHSSCVGTSAVVLPIQRVRVERESNRVCFVHRSGLDHVCLRWA